MKVEKMELRGMKIEIVLESEEEIETFRHVLGCWDEQKGCDRPESAKHMARELWNRLY
jgi:hypothetical protein